MFALKEADRVPFMKALEALDATYDPEWKAPRGYLEKAKYHTRLAMCPVHSTRAAIDYALALLDSGLDEHLARAIDIIENMISLQDTDPSNATFGIWSWYMEEPLDQMSPPDWNWADFCGKSMLNCLLFHRDRLPADLVGRMEQCVKNACLSIFRRNVTTLYTNISIMGSYVTLCAGEMLDWPDMIAYGRARLAKQLAFVEKNGCFSEFNSPTYTMIALEDLTGIHSAVRDAQAHEIAEKLLNVAWKSVAEHFHAPTGQWVGPCTRAYSWLLPNETRATLARALVCRRHILSRRGARH